MNDMKPILERLTHVMEKQYRNNRRGRRIVEIGDQDQVHMTDQVHRIDQRVEKDLIVEIKIMEAEVKTRTQERRGTIQALDIPQVCSVIIVK